MWQVVCITFRLNFKGLSSAVQIDLSFFLSRLASSLFFSADSGGIARGNWPRLPWAANVYSICSVLKTTFKSITYKLRDFSPLQSAQTLLSSNWHFSDNFYYHSPLCLKQTYSIYTHTQPKLNLPVRTHRLFTITFTNISLFSVAAWHT